MVRPPNMLLKNKVTVAAIVFQTSSKEKYRFAKNNQDDSLFYLFESCFLFEWKRCKHS